LLLASAPAAGRAAINVMVRAIQRNFLMLHSRLRCPYPARIVAAMQGERNAEFGTCVGEKRNRHLEQFCWKSPRIDAGSAVPTSSHFGAADRNAQNLIADEAVEMSDDRPQRPKAKTGSAIDRFDPRLAD